MTNAIAGTRRKVSKRQALQAQLVELEELISVNNEQLHENLLELNDRIGIIETRMRWMDAHLMQLEKVIYEDQWPLKPWPAHAAPHAR